MKKTQLLLGSTLCLGLMAGLAVPTNAATDVTIEIQETDLNNNIGYVEDKDGDGIPDADMSEFSVTVPAVLPIIFNSDGTNTLPTNWQIENHSSIANISLTKVEFDAKDSGWKLLPKTQEIDELSADTKAMKFYMGKSSSDLALVTPTNEEGTVGSRTWENGSFTIPVETAKNVSFNVERGAFTSSESAARAFEMLLTFEFNK